MAPIKFEEQIKDKLEQRTVVPSADAWSKLSQRLDADDKRNKKSAFWWIGIAASIAILITISIGYFNNGNESEKIDDTIVKDNIEDVIAPKTDRISIENKAINLETQQLVSEQKNSEKQHIEVNTSIATSQNQNKPIKKTAINPNNNFVAKTDKRALPKQEEIGSSNNLPDKAIAQTPEINFKSIKAELQNVKSKNTVTDHEIDSLLKAANKTLFINKTLKKKSTVVNADALLQDVEDAMGQSFRSRVYEALKGGYKEVKKAVAQRNAN